MAGLDPNSPLLMVLAIVLAIGITVASIAIIAGALRGTKPKVFDRDDVHGLAALFPLSEMVGSDWHLQLALGTRPLRLAARPPAQISSGLLHFLAVDRAVLAQIVAAMTLPAGVRWHASGRLPHAEISSDARAPAVFAFALDVLAEAARRKGEPVGDVVSAHRYSGD